MPTTTDTAYTCWDDSGTEIEIEAADAAAAAAEYVTGGEWGSGHHTRWITVYVSEAGEEPETYKVAVEPTAPRCTAGGEHDWRAPHSLVGGCERNPGVFGSGGGVLVLEACITCGCGRATDTWAQDPVDGEQGLRAVRYEPDAYVVDGHEAEADLDDE